MDPVIEKFPWVTPYNYAENEPVGHIDLWGLQKAKPNENQNSISSASGAAPINIYNSQLRINYANKVAKLEPWYSPDRLTAQHSLGVLKRTELKENTRAKMIGGRAHLDKADPIKPKFESGKTMVVEGYYGIEQVDEPSPRFFKANKGMTNLAKASRVSGVAGVTMTAVELGTAAQEGRLIEQAEIETGKLAGAWLGMKVFGAAAAASPDPFTKTPVGATIAVGIGGVVGSIGGEKAVRSIQNNVSISFTPPERTGMGYTTCFVAGTKVLMADGCEKNIELVQEGDLILGVNTDLMKIEIDTVTLIPKRIKTYRKIKIELENRKIVEFSPAHPFWVVNKGWCVFDLEEAKTELTFPVKKLEVGDLVLQYERGDLKEVKVISLYDTGEIIQMYNLENVAKNHSFFAEKILVHNKRQ